MALEVIKQIVDIEKEGEELVKKSQQRAAEILKAARDEADAVIAGARTEAEAYYKNVVLGYEKQASDESLSIKEKNEKKIKELGNISSDLMNRAVEMVIERIVNTHGNS